MGYIGERYVYKVTNKLTNQFYIGKRRASKDVSAEEDFGKVYFTSASVNSWIKDSLKNEPDNWIVEFLHRNVESDELLNELESIEIDKYFNGRHRIDSLCLNAYNPKNNVGFDTTGFSNPMPMHVRELHRQLWLGDNNPRRKRKFTTSEETKAKLRESCKGVNLGAERPQEERDRISETLKEYYKTHDNPFKGRKHSEESLEKNRQAHLGKKHSDETKKLISSQQKGLHWYNNGVKNVRCKECPIGFVSGRLYKRKEITNAVNNK